MAYRQFLKSNGISHDNVEEAEYCNVLESQKIVGQDLDLLADSNNTRDVSLLKCYTIDEILCLQAFHSWSWLLEKTERVHIFQGFKFL